MKKYFAEALGTFGLVFAGTGAIIVNDLHGGVITHVGVALVFGLIVMTMIYAIVTAGLRCAPLISPVIKTATNRAIAPPKEMTIQPELCPLVPFSTTLPTTPSPKKIIYRVLF